MYFNSSKIKLSFSRAKYKTEGNTVYCTLQYTVNIPGVYSDMIAIMDNDEQIYTVTAKATCFQQAAGPRNCKRQGRGKSVQAGTNSGEQAGEGGNQEVL